MSKKLAALVAAASACALATPGNAVTTVASTDANAMAAALAGSGFNLIGATLTTTGPTENGFFNSGAAALGINSGVVLTTGSLACASGTSNTTDRCGGVVSTDSPGTATSLQLTFTLTGDQLYFNYVFGSEEYNEFVNQGYNDGFELILNGAGYANVNLAQLPGGGGVVSIDNVNNGSNSGYYKDNTSGAYPIELDGLTTVLTASATGLTVGSVYTLTFNVFDRGDQFYDSAVFVQAGTVGTTPTPSVPEPGTWLMMIAGIGLTGAFMRRRAKAVSFA